MISVGNSVDNLYPIIQKGGIAILNIIAISKLIIGNYGWSGCLIMIFNVYFSNRRIIAFRA